MGAWGYTAFENDTACDWGAAFASSPDLRPVAATLSRVVNTPEGESLDSDLGSSALAACEVIARLQGNWGKRDPYTSKIDQWVEEHPQAVRPELRKLALEAIERILAPSSELAELWDDDEWREAVSDLESRVRL